MATYRSASYTRGVQPSANSSLAYKPLDGRPNFDDFSQRPTLSQQNSLNSSQSSFQDSSMGLHQYRRHSASMSAAPIRGQAYQHDDDDEIKTAAAKKLRSASWNAESQTPKFNAAEGRNGKFVNFLRRLEEIKYHGAKMIRNNRKEVLSWITLFCLIIVGYKFFSDGSFSAVLTLSSALQCFAIILLNMKVLSQQSVAGVSQRTLYLIVFSICLRLVSTLFYNGYLPVDRSGDWVYQAADILTVIFALILILYSRRCCHTSIQQQQDKDTCIIVVPVVITFILSLIVHPSLNQNLMADVAWTFSLYVETFSMIPQLFMMGKLGGEVEALTSHYVASMAGAKVFSFLFWYFSYAELAPKHGNYNFAGWAVLFSNCAQALLFVDFFYYYVKSIRVGRKMIINF